VGLSMVQCESCRRLVPKDGTVSFVLRTDSDSPVEYRFWYCSTPCIENFIVRHQVLNLDLGPEDFQPYLEGMSNV